MKTWKTVSLDRRERNVSSVNPGYIGFYTGLAVVFVFIAATNALVGDWGDVIDGVAFAFAFWTVAERSRDVNALMGGYR